MKYIVGYVKEIFQDYLIFENNNIGYCVKVIDPQKFILNQKYKFLIHEEIKIKKNNTICKKYFAFEKEKNYIFFNFLLTIVGIGPKIAMNIMKNNIASVIAFLRDENILALSSLKGFTIRIANLLVENTMKGKKIKEIIKLFDLEVVENEQKQEQKKEESEKFEINEENLFLALKSIGYKEEEAESSILLWKNCNKQFNNFDDAVGECIKNIVNSENINKQDN